MGGVKRLLDREWTVPKVILDVAAASVSPRPAAVLVPLYVRDRELYTLLTKRTETVEHHKGQISFPGGAQEESDPTLWDTALRETQEEIGVPRRAVRYLGKLPGLVTVTDFAVTPFVAALPYPLAFRLAEGEVEAVLQVPIAALRLPGAVEQRTLTWKGREVPTPVYHHEGQAIWGATAWILSNLLGALADGAGPQA